MPKYNVLLIERITALWFSDGALVRSCGCGNRSKQRHWSGHRCRTDQEGAQSGRPGTQGGKGGGECAVSLYRLSYLCTKLWKCRGAWQFAMKLRTFLGTLVNMKIKCYLLQLVYWTVHHCDSLRIKEQLDVTCYFISLLMCSICFGWWWIYLCPKYVEHIRSEIK